jgi:hypothetical protein
MKFGELLDLLQGESLFETGLLLAGDVDPREVRVQLSRWVRSGRLIQLRRGLYSLAPPFEKARPHPFVVANRLVHGSYVSLQSALAHHGLIPEHVPVVTSVTRGRPGRWTTPLGTFEFHHLKSDLVRGFRRTPLGPAEAAFVATPEKALLDLLYLEPGADAPAYLAELRLQQLDALDLASLRREAEAMGRPKLRRAAREIARLAESAAVEYEEL